MGNPTFQCFWAKRGERAALRLRPVGSPKAPGPQSKQKCTRLQTSHQPPPGSCLKGQSSSLFPQCPFADIFPPQRCETLACAVCKGDVLQCGHLLKRLQMDYIRSCPKKGLLTSQTKEDAGKSLIIIVIIIIFWLLLKSDLSGIPG